jgi:hypothetical protein
MKLMQAKLDESQKYSTENLQKLQNDFKIQIEKLKEEYQQRMKNFELKKFMNLEKKVSFQEERLKESESTTNNLKRKISEKFETLGNYLAHLNQ